MPNKNLPCGNDNGLEIISKELASVSWRITRRRVAPADMTQSSRPSSGSVLCALCVSAYIAYVQRQQVRAAVWPILEFDSSNAPIHFTLANKGVGPAIIRHVIVKVDGQPVRNWKEAVERILGPGYLASESDMSFHVFAAGESRTVFTTRDPETNPLNFDKSNSLWVTMN